MASWQESDNSSSEDDLAMAAVITTICLVINKENNKRKKRSSWSRQSLLKRQQLGASTAVVDILRPEPTAFKSFLRMDEETFNNLLQRVAPAIQRQDTIMRDCISPQERLIATLRYLASGMSYQDLESYHKIGKSTLSILVPETCKSIYDALSDEFLKFPNSPDEWEKIAKRFSEKWNFPHCIGAMDGKHVRIQKPAKSGSTYFNYKKYCSIVLMAIVDADYKFLFVDVGANGKVPDGAIFQNCGLAEHLENNTLNLPEDKSLTGFSGNLPYIFVGDDAFPLKRNLLKPYPQRNLTLKKRVFNYRLSRARRVSENAFGILASRFRIFQHPIQLNPHKTDAVVLAAVSLHNFLRDRLDEAYVPPGLVDTETAVQHNNVNGAWRQDDGNTLDGLLPQGSNRSATSAQELRDDLAEYFCSTDGEVPWQWRKAVLGDQ